MQNRVKESALVAVHRAMENQPAKTCQHIASKAEKYRKEFPFIYRYYEVTEIPDCHAEGGEVVVCRLHPTLQHTLILNFCSVVRGHGYLR